MSSVFLILSKLFEQDWLVLLEQGVELVFFLGLLAPLIPLLIFQLFDQQLVFVVKPILFLVVLFAFFLDVPFLFEHRFDLLLRSLYFLSGLCSRLVLLGLKSNSNGGGERFYRCLAAARLGLVAFELLDFLFDALFFATWVSVFEHLLQRAEIVAFVDWRPDDLLHFGLCWFRTELNGLDWSFGSCTLTLFFAPLIARFLPLFLSYLCKLFNLLLALEHLARILQRKVNYEPSRST